MRFTVDVNNVKETEKMVCMRLTVMDSNNRPSVITIPVLIDEYDDLSEGFNCTAELVGCDDDKLESLDDFEFGSTTDFQEVVDDIEMEFSGCLDSFHDMVKPNMRTGELQLVPKIDCMDWKRSIYDRFERFAKGLDDEDLDPRKFDFLKHNVNIVLYSLIPYQREKFTKHLQATISYTDTTTLKIHLAVKAILKVIDDLEATYIEALEWSK